MDLLINFRTTYIDENDNEVVDFSSIAVNYVKSTSFYLDLISTLPISEIMSALN